MDPIDAAPPTARGPPSWTLRAVGVALCVALLVAAAVFFPSPRHPTGFASEPSLEPRAVLHTSLGDITLGLYEQMVPLTAGRFIDLANAGHYNGTAVDRIVKGYDVQMGDPASGGHPLPVPIPDEFHPALRHEGPGVVSMATSAPDAGTGTFFITTATIHSYDDRYSVFGHVLAGMDVVDAIEARPIDGTTFGPPQQPVTLLSVTIHAATPTASAVRHGAAVATLADDKTASAESGATYAVIVTNTGTVRDVVALAAEAPDGWTATFENPRVALPAGRSWLVLLTVVPDAGAAQRADVTVTVHSEAQPSRSDTAVVHATLGAYGATPPANASVTVEYTGLLRDGRIFDTTDARLAASADHTRMQPFFVRQTFAPYTFTLGQGEVIAGFDALVAATRQGESSVGLVGWTAGPLPPDVLYHRDLVFEVRVVSVAA